MHIQLGRGGLFHRQLGKARRQTGFSPTIKVPGSHETRTRDSPFTFLFPPDDDDETTVRVQTTTRVVPPPVTNTPPPIKPTTSTPAPIPAPTTTPTIITSSTTVLPTTKPTTSTVLTTSVSTQPVLTVSRTPSSSVAVGSAASSSTNSPTSASKTGPIVGGVAAGLAGIVAICIVVAFIMRRRMRKRSTDATFDVDAFRRSAVMLDDPPVHGGRGIGPGFEPRPTPTMEQMPRTPIFGTMYGSPATSPYHDDYSHAQHYDVAAAPPSRAMMASPQSATSANPFFTPVQSHFSPIATPISAVHEPYGQEHVMTPTVFTRSSSSSANTSNLSRQPSNDTLRVKASDPVQYASYPSLSSDAARHSVPLPSSDYADLSRSSVTPFQAAQYVEISKKLDTDVPAGLNTPAYNQYIHGTTVASDELPPPVPLKDLTSPFADPVPNTPVDKETVVAEQSDAQYSDDNHLTSQDLDFPAPPSPAITTSSRYRVDSTPPILPEIRVESRNSAYDFPNSVRGSAVPEGYPSGLSATTAADIASGSQLPAGRFAATPSPLANSVIMPPAPVVLNPVSPATPITASSDAEKAEKKRPETIYDPEDAYGGI